MRGNKYKISKKRRLRRRGKYSKKLKPKSRKGGRWLSSFRGFEKDKVEIRATCKIPEFFFESHDLFNSGFYTKSINELKKELTSSSNVEKKSRIHYKSQSWFWISISYFDL